MGHNKIHITNFQSLLFKEYLEGIKLYQFEEPGEYELHPEGMFEMIFQFDQGFNHQTSCTKGWEQRPESFLGGMHTQSYKIQPTNKNSVILGIQFKSHATRNFVLEDLGQFKNKVIDFHDVLDSDSLDNCLRINEEGWGDHTLKNVDQLLKGLYKQSKMSPIELAVQQIEGCNGKISIGDLSKNVGMSPSNFRKVFNEQVGMSPKEFCKIVRFKHVVQILATSSNINYTKLAIDMGYFDQAHFIKDFKTVTGKSLRHFMS